jgi:hypothetical protein
MNADTAQRIRADAYRCIRDAAETFGEVFASEVARDCFNQVQRSANRGLITRDAFASLTDDAIHDALCARSKPSRYLRRLRIHRKRGQA